MPSELRTPRKKSIRKVRPLKGGKLPQWIEDAKKVKRQLIPSTPSNRRRFRRVKVVRPCAVRMIFLAPLLILLLERYLGTVIKLDDVTEAYYNQINLEPWKFVPPISSRLGVIPDLANMTFTPPIKCPFGQRRMLTVPNARNHKRKIPYIVHQSSKTRCLTRHFEGGSVKWALAKHAYFIHDLDAVSRLLESNFPEFPQLRMISGDCLPLALKFGLWKYLALWTWGGIYADLNSFPNNFTASTLTDDDDGFFILEEARFLSAKLFAVSPKHPLMYYAIQHAISNILQMKVGEIYQPRDIVGEDPLQKAYFDFVSGPKKRPILHTDIGVKSRIQDGIAKGKYGRSIRITRALDSDVSFATKIFISQGGRSKEYAKMGMIDLDGEVSCSSCLIDLMTRYEKH